MPLRPLADEKQEDLSTGLVSERVYQRFKRDIITGFLEPGRPLTEAFLTNRFGASRTPIRETCARLQSERLLELVPNKGYSVAPVSLKMVQELFQLRTLLEEFTVEKACGKKDQVLLARLETLSQVPHVRGNRESFIEFIDANFEFHITIAELAGNQRIARTLADAMNQLARAGYVSLGHEEDTSLAVSEHGEIVRAIREGLPEDGKNAIRAHIESSKERILKAFWE